MKMNPTRLCWLLVLAALLCGSAMGDEVTVAIRIAHAKAYSTPSTHGTVVATLQRDDTFVVVDDLPYWYKIVLKDGKTAYVRKAVCTVLGPDDLENQPSDLTTNTSTTTTSSTLGTSQPINGCTVTSVPADWSICPADGSGGKYGEAYKQKNRLQIACSYAPISVDGMLALRKLSPAVRSLPNGDPDLQYLQGTEKQTVVLEGFVALAKDGGQEGVNCKSSTRLDTHIELVGTDSEDPSTNRSTHVIAEVTPWFHDAFPAWSTQALCTYASYCQGYTGAEQHAPRKIRVYGYLFFDEAHATGADNWRGTAWEVHPITKVEVFENGQWKALQ